jgi:hypothetical protein
MSTDDHARVEHACTQLAAQGRHVTFPDVAALTGISRTTLYRRPELRAQIEEHRVRNRDANTLTGLTVQLDQLRHALDALAARVRHHEELLRRLQRQTTTSIRAVKKN